MKWSSRNTHSANQNSIRPRPPSPPPLSLSSSHGKSPRISQQFQHMRRCTHTSRPILFFLIVLHLTVMQVNLPASQILIIAHGILAEFTFLSGTRDRRFSYAFNLAVEPDTECG